MERTPFVGLRDPRPFVGRSSELDELRVAFELAATAEPRLVLVEAEAGMGKTSLIREFLSRLDQVFVCEADADESEASLRYGLLSQLVRSMGDELVSRTALLASGPPASADPFAVGAELLQCAGVIQGKGTVLVIVLDDMQWADKASAQALLFALRRMRHDRALAIVSTRSGTTSHLGDSWQRLLEDRSRVHRLQLAGLGPREIQQLATELGLDGITAGSAQRLMEHTAGHPFYLTALMEELPTEALRTGGSPLPAPRSLTATVLSRLGGLSHATQDFVGAVAVLGQRCPLRVAVTLAGLKDGATALEEAIEARLLERRSSGTAEEVAFAHPLIRAAVYEDLSPTRRRALHTKAAELLSGPPSLFHRVAATPSCDDELARELEEVALGEVVADQTSLAIDHLLTAAELSSDKPSRDRRFLAAVHVMIVAGDEPRVRAVKDSIDACDDGPAKSYALGSLAMQRGRTAEAERHLEAAAGAAADDSQAPYRARACVSLAVLNLLRGSGESAAEWAQRALDADATDPVVGVFARLPLAVGLATSGRVGEGLEVLKEPSARVARPRAFEANLVSERGRLRLWANDLAGAVEDLTTALRWSRFGRPVRNPAALHASLADAQYRIGQWEQALVNAEIAVSLAKDMEMIYDLPTAHAVATYVHAGRGDWNLSEQHSRRARECAAIAPSTGALLFAALAEAVVAQARGHPDGMLRALELCLRDPVKAYVERMVVVPWRLLYSEALIGTGRLDEADRTVAALEDLAMAHPFPATRLQALRLRGTLESARGNAQEAESSFTEANRIAASAHLPFACSLVELAHGQFLRRVGKRRSAISHLRAARDGLGSMGARPYVDLCDLELMAAGLHSAKRGAVRPVELTEREQSVAHLVASGLSNSEAAAELYVSVKTVEYHLSNVFSKLSISSRRQVRGALADYHS